MPIKSQSEKSRALRVRWYVAERRAEFIDGLSAPVPPARLSVLVSNLQQADRLISLPDRALLMDPVAVLWTKDAKLHA